LTDAATFKEIEEYWIQEVKNSADNDVEICLVGNKCDMTSSVEDTEINLLTQAIGLKSYKVSAKTGEGV